MVGVHWEYEKIKIPSPNKTKRPLKKINPQKCR
jgi:hypothetical protein